MSRKTTSMQEKQHSALAALPVKERNAAFKKLTRRQQAVEVAKDTIAQLAAERYNATPGTYFSVESTQDLETIDKSFQVVLDTPVVCNVCAIGGVFASMIRLQNTVRTSLIVDDAYDDTYMLKKLEGIFSGMELRAMEFVFENNYRSDSFGEATRVALLAYRDKIVNDFDRSDEARHATYYQVKRYRATYVLRTLMLNVINNDGAFVVKGAKIRTHKK